MDKLIEAAQGLIALGPPERAQDQLWSTWQKRVKAYNLLVAAVVRAHDAGTDEELRKPTDIGNLRGYLFAPFDCKWNAIVRDVTAEHEHDGECDAYAVFKNLVQIVRDNGQLDHSFPARMRLEEMFDVPRASRAAESAPLLPSDTLHICTACWAGNHGSCSGGKCGCVHESASVAQLDAEDQHRAAEPVEDAVERIVCHACGMAMVFRRVDTKTLETFHTCAEARKGYVKLEDVEKVIREFESKYDISRWTPDYLITELRAHLAPKPEPSQSAVIDTLRSEDFQRANACIECGTLVVHQELHAKWHAALVDRRTK